MGVPVAKTEENVPDEVLLMMRVPVAVPVEVPLIEPELEELDLGETELEDLLEDLLETSLLDGVEDGVHLEVDNSMRNKQLPLPSHRAQQIQQMRSRPRRYRRGTV